ncbi:kinase-like domain-containing protein [Chlamydoabsidia padenii]|nr:kinase-like domain-containing protein [Chlamydoabsidia padenii]
MTLYIMNLAKSFWIHHHQQERQRDHIKNYCHQTRSMETNRNSLSSDPSPPLAATITPVATSRQTPDQYYNQVDNSNIRNTIKRDHHRQSMESEEGSISSNDGIELVCKRKFSKMVQTTYQLQMKPDMTTTIQALFDGDYIHIIRLTLPNGRILDYPFTGNSQYIPPEVYLHACCSHGLSDVWVLGISLYQMLVGNYPFKAKDDRKLVKKMLHADFSIPDHLSEDVKDLLRRMLAPEQTRASLDLVMFHPWMKPYRMLLSTTSLQSLVPTCSRISLRINKKARKSKWWRLINKTCRFLFLGPYSPPSKPYRELAHLGK